jgi:2-(1,2-epoxy-1,2-dihydrophenyl)acetyl-CoA isomerase
MDNIVVSVDASGIALLELNRPASLNALSVDLIGEMKTALGELAADEKVGALIITGKGRAFCAGADLSGDLRNSTAPASPGERVAATMAREFNPLMEMIYTFPRPVVTAINGIAAGGGAGLALCSDLAVASDTASVKVVQVQQLGIAADLGANWLLQRIAGRGRAMAACLLSDTIPATTLLEWGAIWDCVPPAELLDTARGYALRLADVPAATVLATRQLIDGSSAVTYTQSIEEERLCQRELCDGPVFLDSVRRFMAKS